MSRNKLYIHPMKNWLVVFTADASQLPHLKVQGHKSLPVSGLRETTWSKVKKVTASLKALLTTKIAKLAASSMGSRVSKTNDFDEEVEPVLSVTSTGIQRWENLIKWEFFATTVCFGSFVLFLTKDCKWVQYCSSEQALARTKWNCAFLCYFICSNVNNDFWTFRTRIGRYTTVSLNYLALWGHFSLLSVTHGLWLCIIISYAVQHEWM